MIKSTGCAAKMSLASPALLCRTPAMESSALVLRTRYRTAVRAVRVRERLRSIASGENGTHGLHAA